MNVILHGKRDSAGAIELRVMRWRLSRWAPNVITRVLIRGKQEGQSRRRCDARSRGWGDAGPQAKECERRLEAGKGKEMGFPLEPPERNTAFDFSPEDPFQTSDLQNHKIINLGCFKPLSLWLLVTAAVGN